MRARIKVCFQVKTRFSAQYKRGVGAMQQGVQTTERLTSTCGRANTLIFPFFSCARLKTAMRKHVLASGKGWHVGMDWVMHSQNNNRRGRDAARECFTYHTILLTGVL